MENKAPKIPMNEETLKDMSGPEMAELLLKESGTYSDWYWNNEKTEAVVPMVPPWQGCSSRIVNIQDLQSGVRLLMEEQDVYYMSISAAIQTEIRRLETEEDYWESVDFMFNERRILYQLKKHFNYDWEKDPDASLFFGKATQTEIWKYHLTHILPKFGLEKTDLKDSDFNKIHLGVNVWVWEAITEDHRFIWYPPESCVMVDKPTAAVFSVEDEEWANPLTVWDPAETLGEAVALFHSFKAK